MIEPGELHRYFAVREIANGGDVWILGGDTRYEVTGPGFGDYRIAPDGDYFLAAPYVLSYPTGRPMRLEEVEPLPDGGGLYHPDAADSRALQLARTYEGSWRQYAAETGCTELACEECGAPAGQACEIWCIADMAQPSAALIDGRER
jgi:hypothetical protein